MGLLSHYVPTLTMLPRAVPEPGSPSERIVDATVRCLSRWGMAKTTVDDVAREAGVGRATLYRLFPGGRDALLDAVLAAETGRFLNRVEREVAGARSLEDLLVTLIVEAGSALTGHAAFQYLLIHEPEVVLPQLAFAQMDTLLRRVARFGGPLLSPWLAGDDPDEAAARGAEWVARIVLSYLMAPSADVDLCDAASVRHLVRTYILPGLMPADHQGEPACPR
jgi:AcrR family transcriptional regulator